MNLEETVHSWKGNYAQLEGKTREGLVNAWERFGKRMGTFGETCGNVLVNPFMNLEKPTHGG